MTKTVRPEGPQDSLGASSELHPGIRERVRQHLLKMAPLALLAATPLTNMACDSMPLPVCQGDWGDQIVAKVFWGLDEGDKILIVEITAKDDAVSPPRSYVIEGGSFLTTGKSDRLKIKPDADATVITLTGTSTCGPDSKLGLKITINLLPPDGGSAGAAPTVKVWW